MNYSLWMLILRYFPFFVCPANVKAAPDVGWPDIFNSVDSLWDSLTTGCIFIQAKYGNILCSPDSRRKWNNFRRYYLLVIRVDLRWRSGTSQHIFPFISSTFIH